MTDDEILAEFKKSLGDAPKGTFGELMAAGRAIAERAAAEEREACIRLCETRIDARFDQYGIREHDTNAGYYPSIYEWMGTADEEANDIKDAIRARGQS